LFGPGVIDGHDGLSTVNAIKGFQEANALTVTGALDPETRAKVYAAYRDYFSTDRLMFHVSKIDGHAGDGAVVLEHRVRRDGRGVHGHRRLRRMGCRR
jgi:peptidoglycan hydrolase-like protein with peptidoglycan-binding domain